MNANQIARRIAILEARLNAMTVKAPLRMMVAIAEELRALRAL